MGLDDGKYIWAFDTVKNCFLTNYSFEELLKVSKVLISENSEI